MNDHTQKNVGKKSAKTSQYKQYKKSKTIKQGKPTNIYTVLMNEGVDNQINEMDEIKSKEIKINKKRIPKKAKITIYK